MTHFHDRSDLKHMADLKKAAPREFAAWLQLDQIVGTKDGAIPRKYRELIALAVAHSTQCVYCIDVHLASAVKLGVTKEEVAEAVLLAAALRSGAAGAHGSMTMRLYDEHAADNN